MKRLTIILMVLSISAYSQKPDRAYRIIEASYISLNIADYALTVHGLNKGGHELNPIAKNMTPYSMAGLKLASTASVVILGRVAYKQNPRAAKFTMFAMNLVTALVVTNNISVVINLNQ